MDCSLHANLCGHFEVDVVPSFRFIPAGEQYALDDGLVSARGENLIAYGHYDELYGRTRELDLIAHDFMNHVGAARGLEGRRRRSTASDW